MKNTFAASLALALATLAAGQAMAATDEFGIEFPASYGAAPAAGGNTREQVRAELVQANRAAPVAADEFGVALPTAYAAAPADSLTREQVRADLVKANNSAHVRTDEFGIALPVAG